VLPLLMKGEPARWLVMPMVLDAQKRVGGRCSNVKGLPVPHKCLSPKCAHYLTIVKTLRTTTAPSALALRARARTLHDVSALALRGRLTRSIMEHQ
jgi:hypothetical protein